MIPTVAIVAGVGWLLCVGLVWALLYAHGERERELESR